MGPDRPLFVEAGPNSPIRAGLASRSKSRARRAHRLGQRERDDRGGGRAHGVRRLGGRSRPHLSCASDPDGGREGGNTRRRQARDPYVSVRVSTQGLEGAKWFLSKVLLKAVVAGVVTSPGTGRARWRRSRIAEEAPKGALSFLNFIPARYEHPLPPIPPYRTFICRL